MYYCHLQVKRQAFPRFYFLADDELLELLSRCRDTDAVQPHLRKCFDGVYSLDFGSGAGSNTINAMVSRPSIMFAEFVADSFTDACYRTGSIYRTFLKVLAEALFLSTNHQLKKNPLSTLRPMLNPMG